MKSIVEIEKMLAIELREGLNRMKSNEQVTYYNEVFGDTSFVLAKLINLRLEERIDDWDSTIWFDDSLLTRIMLESDRLLIWGIIIWGKEDINDQWTDPIYFETALDQVKGDMSCYTFMFGDLNIPSISYEEFNMNRGIWDSEYYLSPNWDPSDRNWRYEVREEH